MPRSGLEIAVTGTPADCRPATTPFQDALSAKAPCTRATVGRVGATMLASDTGALLTNPRAWTRVTLAAAVPPEDELLGSGRLDRHLPQLGPAVLRDREVHDPRGLGQVRRQLAPRSPEVLGVDVRAARLVVPERLDEHVLGRVVEAPRPVEPQAARLGTGRLGEGLADRQPGVGVLGTDPELGGDGDHLRPSQRLSAR